MEHNTSSILYKLGLDTIRELETEQGILASSRNEAYGCIFGRDSLITCLKLLRAYDSTKDQYFLELARKILINLVGMQGREVNIESGEEPGKCIHEYRPHHHEHLTNREIKPWYIYPDKIMRNFDSLDATPLLLIAIYRYWQKSKNDVFLIDLMPNIKSAIHWMINYGDSNRDGFLDYMINPNRKGGGLMSQGWMDSEEVIFHEDGTEAVYPIAPVEVQSYYFLALRLWSIYFSNIGSDLGEDLRTRMDNLKQAFNKKFILTKENGEKIFASAIDGAGRPCLSSRSSIGHCLWANLNMSDDGVSDCILETKNIPYLVKRLMSADLFEPEAGIRTLSSDSKKFDPNSYHNGSIWPHDNSMVAEGLAHFGYISEAAQIRRAILKAVQHFNSPIELFVFYNSQYQDYCSVNGHTSCKKQAWSAASILTATLGLEQI